MKYKEIYEKLRNVDFFTFKYLSSIVGQSYAKLLIHKWLKENKIVRLCKGVYSFKKSPYLLTNYLVDAYIGLGSAAFLLGFWNQVPNIIILTPLNKIRFGERIINGEKVIIRKISRKMYFGWDFFYLKDYNHYIKISTPEKLLIDLFYFDYGFKDEIVPNLMKNINTHKLKEFLKILEERKVKGYKRIIKEVLGLI